MGIIFIKGGGRKMSLSNISCELEKIELASKNYLSLMLDNSEKILDYQAGMINNKKDGGILKIELRRLNDKVKLLYDITSKASLSSLVGKKEFSKEEFLNVLKTVSQVLIDAKKYYLKEGNFILDIDYVYIDENTGDASLVYIPIERSIKPSLVDEFRTLIKTLLIEATVSDNYFIGGILDFTKREGFSVAEFSKYVDGILNGKDEGKELNLKNGEVKVISQVTNVTINQKFDNGYKKPAAQSEQLPPVAPPVKSPSGSLNGRSQESLEQPAIDKNPIAGKKPVKQEKIEQTVTKKVLKKNIKLIAILLQVLIVLIIAIIAFGAGLEMSMVGGLVLVLGAVDGLVLKNLLADKNKEEIEVATSSKTPKETNRRKANTEDIGSTKKEAVKQPAKTAAKQPEQSTVKREISTVMPSTMQSNSLDTELLDSIPYLISNRSGVVDRIYINKERFRIGRMVGEVDYAISDNKTIGKAHAEIRKINGKYYLIDLNSKNHTYINGQMLQSSLEYELKDNDRVTFSNSDFSFRLS